MNDFDIPLVGRAGAVRALAAVILVGLVCVVSAPAHADLYAVNGIKVDETAENAVAAKNAAIADGQKRAMDILLGRLTLEEHRAQLPPVEAAQVARLLDSMSVEDERTSGTRYIATLNIRFRRDNVQDMLDQFNVPYADDQAPGTLLIAVWRGENKAMLWETPNPWHAAWSSLNVENSITPLFMPLGDLTDMAAISVDDVLAGDEVKLQAIKDRYAVENILVAVAEPAGQGGVRATVQGTTATGPVSLEETAQAEDGKLETAAAKVARSVLSQLEAAWKADNLKRGGRSGNSMQVAVPFSGLGQWTEIRRRIETTPGIGALEVRKLSPQGAVVEITFSGDLGQLGAQLAQNGFDLTDIGDTWVLQTR